MLSWWKRFDTSETRSNVKELSFHCDNGEQRGEGTLSACRLRRVIDLLADIFARAARYPFDGGRERLGQYGVIDHEIPSVPDEEGANGSVQECVPGPVALQQSRQAVMGHRFKRLCQGDTTHGCAIIEPRGEVKPNQLWHGVLSFVTVGRELDSISPPQRHRCRSAGRRSDDVLPRRDVWRGEP